MQKIDIEDLLNKYKAGTITKEEYALLEDWYIQWKPERQPLSHLDIEQVKNEVWQSLNILPKTTPLWPRIAAAASIILCLSIGGYFLLRPKQLQQQITQKTYKNDVAPGGNKATLTLSNGLKIDLNDQKNGIIAQQGDAQVIKLSNGQLVYNKENAIAQSTVYNTMSTPRGGKYDLVLSDGTKVWLNAASSITYPTIFNGNDRTVNITGEAYFEVAPNKNKPFKVTALGQTVEVLGTHFNINAYTDEDNIKTTLLEGRVKVSKGSGVAFLRPGQQSIIQPSDNKILIKEADLEETVAWKNGLTIFRDADIKTIMRQIARWYDVDVEFKEEISEQRLFTGEISRNSKLSEVFKVLELSNIHFKIEGQKVFVSP